jgi:uncharacterized phage protein gp47/JayE
MSYVVPGLTNGAHGYIDWGARQFIPSEDSDLDSLLRWSNNLLTPPQTPASPASGDVTFTGTDTTVIPIGTEVTNRDGASFTTDAQYVISGTTITGSVTAVVAGVAGNTLEGAAVFLSAPISGIESEAIVAAGGLSGGADDEDKFGVLARLRNRFQSAPRGGASGDFAAWALEISGVDRAYEFAQDPTTGWVTVVVVDDTAGTAPIAGVTTVADAQDNVDLQRPIMMGGCIVMAAVPDTLALTWGSLEPAPGDSISTARSKLEANVDTYILTQTAPGATINVNEIENAAQAVVTSVTLTDPIADPDPGTYGLFDTINHSYV